MCGRGLLNEVVQSTGKLFLDQLPDLSPELLMIDLGGLLLVPVVLLVRGLLLIALLAHGQRCETTS